MVWWIIVGVLALAVLVLWVVASVLLGRLRPLRRAVRRLSIRAEQAQRLQAKVEDQQSRLAALRESLLRAATLAEQVRARRPAREDGRTDDGDQR